MTKIQKIQHFSIFLITCHFVFSAASFAIDPNQELAAKCENRLIKLNPTPLRPLGSETQEHYFKIIDQVADELKGTKDFYSPVAWRKRTGTFGLPGLDLPKEVGGKGFLASEMVKVFEYAGRYGLDLRDISGGGHARALLNSSVPEHRKLLEKVARGDGYIAIAITEKDVGSNIRGMASVAEKAEGGYEITGNKLYNARLNSATDIVIITQAPGQNGKPGKLNAFVVPKNYPGLTFTELEAGGLRGNSFGGVSFNKLFIPENFRIGKDGDGGKLFRGHFAYWRVMQTAAAVGTAKRALEMTFERMNTRVVKGKLIGEMTHLQQELAKHTHALDTYSVYLEKIAEYLDKGDYVTASTMAAGAKSQGVIEAFRAVEFAITTHGASGYATNQNDLMQRMTDLMGLRIADGASDTLMSDYLKKVYGDNLWEILPGVDGQ